MKTDELIQQLSSQLTPVKPMPSNFMQSLKIAFLGLILFTFSFAFMHVRLDLYKQLSNPYFLIDIVLLVALAFASFSLSINLSRPGQSKSVQFSFHTILVILFLVFVFNGFRLAQITSSGFTAGLKLSGLECFFTVLGYSLIISVPIFRILKDGASTNPKLSGVVLGLTCAAFGNILIVSFCPIENGMHLFLWHLLLPISAAVLFGYVIGQKLLRW